MCEEMSGVSLFRGNGQRRALEVRPQRTFAGMQHPNRQPRIERFGELEVGPKRAILERARDALLAPRLLALDREPRLHIGRALRLDDLRLDLRTIEIDLRHGQLGVGRNACDVLLRLGRDGGDKLCRLLLDLAAELIDLGGLRIQLGAALLRLLSGDVGEVLLLAMAADWMGSRISPGTST